MVDGRLLAKRWHPPFRRPSNSPHAHLRRSAARPGARLRGAGRRRWAAWKRVPCLTGPHHPHTQKQNHSTTPSKLTNQPIHPGKSTPAQSTSWDCTPSCRLRRSQRASAPPPSSRRPENDMFKPEHFGMNHPHPHGCVFLFWFISFSFCSFLFFRGGGGGGAPFLGGLSGKQQNTTQFGGVHFHFETNQPVPTWKLPRWASKFFGGHAPSIR